MSVVVLIILIFFLVAAVFGAVAYFTYRRKLRRAKAIERGLKMVPILIHLPPPSSDTQGSNRDIREVMREKTAQAEVLYNLIGGTATDGFKSKFYGQRHLALEVIAVNGVVHFFAAVPVALASTVKKAIQTAYPGARLEEVEDHNIFNQEGRLAATLGGEMVLRTESSYPVATYEKLEKDPMEALLTTISALDKKDGVAVQIMLRPADPSWTKRSILIANGKRKGRGQDLAFSAGDLAKAVIKSPDQRREEERARLGGGNDISNLQLSEIESIEEKTKHPGFEVLIRVIVSTQSVARSQQLLRDIANTFALFEKPGLNGFKFLPALDVQGLVTAFIFRFFPTELKGSILNSVELATLFHLPDSQFTPSTSVERQMSKQVDGPVQLPTVGLLFGYNDFRGVKKEIRLSPEDRRRHTYILGQTGTGKSTMLENLAVQDMVAGNGFAFIDPHGDSAEKILAMVPKERAEDVIYFNPADTDYPLGLNLFEFKDPSQKDFIVQETINMLYKLYDPGHTGIIGPRYEHWYRNAALTLMSDPNGSTFIEIPKVFTDTEYLKQKFKYLKDPTVIDFWTKEMGQTSDYHKSEMLGWFVSKFGAFQNNEMMRNIIGQTKSSFNLRDVMDQQKILVVNLSKGRLGELNSQLLGMIFVIKFQAAAMSRADTLEQDRKDFSLYVDEFQNFSTDSFASILSEARKYRLNLIVANQFIGQLSDEIRDAVFGNIGTIVAHRMGPDDAEFMVKQFAPVFDASDLVNIPNYNAAMRLMIGGLPSQPFSIHDSPPLSSPNLELGLAIKQLSAAKFGHSKSVVEADILDRFSGHSGPAKLPDAAVPGVPAAATPAEPIQPATTAPVPAPIATSPPPAPPVPAAPQIVEPTPVAPVAPTPAPVPTVSPAAVTPYMPATPVAPPAPAAVPAPAPTLDVMATAPPPIGAPPVQIAGVASSGGSVDTGTAATGPAAIIPEANAEAEADQMIQQGGFAPMGSPLPAPPVSNPAPLARAPVLAPEPIVEAEPNQTIPVPVTAVGPAISPIAIAAPPIGAPPVALPGEKTWQAPPPPTQPLIPPAAPAASDSSTLSLRDITGGKPLARPSVDLASITVMTPGTEPPLPVPAPAPVAPPPPPVAAAAPPAPVVPSAPVVPLGSGHALPSDPFANIEVLGDLTPPTPEPSAASSVPVSEVPAAVPPPPPIGSGKPLADDPYANIDILGQVPMPTSGDQGVAPPPVVSAVLPVVAPVPVAVPLPAAAPVPSPIPVSVTPPVTASIAPTPPVIAPAPIPPPVAAPSPIPAPMPVSAPAPMPVPLTPPAQVAPILVPPPPVSTPPIPALITVPPPVPAPQPMAAPSSQVAEPAPANDESLIHFVDPQAQSILNRSELPDTVAPVDGEPSLTGLPEGVEIIHAPVAAQPAVPVSAAPAPVMPPAPMPEPAVAPLTPASEAVKPELTHMAQEPPPIGAAPVALAGTPAPSVNPVVTPAVVSSPASAPSEELPTEPEPEPKAEPAPRLEHASEPRVSESSVDRTSVFRSKSNEISSDKTISEDRSVHTEDKPSGNEAKTASVGDATQLESVAQMLEDAPKPVEQKDEEKPEIKASEQHEPETTPVDSQEAVPEQAPHLEEQRPEPETPEVASVILPEPKQADVHGSQAQPKEPESQEAQIEKAEHEIDDLLSVSLIHSDPAAAHRRLPEPVESGALGEEQGGIDMEMNSGQHRRPEAPVGTPQHMAEHHGLKVLQPLEPIVPPKEQFAKELAALNAAEQPQPVTPAPAASPVAAAVPPPPTPLSPPSAELKPVVPVPVASEPTPAPPKPPVDLAPSEPAIVKHEAEMLPADEPPVAADDGGLPQPESLAANDVAKVRAEREAAMVMQKPAPQETPQPNPASAPAATEAPGEAGGKKRHRKRGGRNRDQGVNQPQPANPPAELPAPKPAEEESQSNMAGKLILPTGERPSLATVQPVMEKPKKLAPGEVYVDANGNVMTGD